MASFFSAEPHAAFLKWYLADNNVNRAFVAAEEGDFGLNLLALSDLDELHLCDSCHRSMMTTEIKLRMLAESAWHDLEHTFCGPQAVSRLHQTGHWVPESFAQIQNFDDHLHYLSELEAYQQLRQQLDRVSTYHQNIFSQLQQFEPQAFDLIYLANILDQPAKYVGHVWPELLSSRLRKDGQVLARTSQDPEYLTGILSNVGFSVQSIGGADYQPRSSTVLMFK